MAAINMRVLTALGKKAFAVLRASRWVKDFYLSGGTALALQLGHRTSVDFDFFSPTNPVLSDWRESFAANLGSQGDVEIQSQNDGTLLLRFTACR